MENGGFNLEVWVMKTKALGAKVVVGSSSDNGMVFLFARAHIIRHWVRDAQIRNSYALILSLALVSVLLCGAYVNSRIIHTQFLLQTASRLLHLNASSLSSHVAVGLSHQKRPWIPGSLPKLQGEPDDTESSHQNLRRDDPSSQASPNVGGCDLFRGSWVKDAGSHPLYHPESCSFIEKEFRCKQNGRLDSEYLKWRWQPRDCNIPRFHARSMLEKLRGRRVVFVGDSLGRNQWESLLCMLAEGVENKTSIYEANGNPITKRKGCLAIFFEGYNCSVEYFRAPFLVRRAAAPAGSPAKVKSVLVVDAMHPTWRRWRTADLLIFNAGHWWTPQKTIQSGCYFQEGGRVVEDMTIQSAFMRSIATWGEWVSKHVDTSQTFVFFRSYSPPHFRFQAYTFAYCRSSMFDN